jgi:glutamyl-tRNA reductase
MGILGLGISFRRAPIELLERLAFADDDLPKAYRLAAESDALDEAVILSTCNRVEVYGSVASYHAGFLALKQLLIQTRSVASEELAEPLYAHWERDAAEHLFEVAAGLDSMVLGETQIHAQVRDAVRSAESEGAAGPAMTALFHSASRAGRRVRQETSLGAAPDAFVAMGVDLVGEALGALADRSVLIVGAGQMSSLAVEHLRGRGVGDVRILNRSLDRARALAERAGAEYGELGTLQEAMAGADVVVSATGASGYVVHHGAVAATMRSRARRPLVLLDLAVPRDVDPEVAYVDAVRVIDVVTLRDRIGEHDPRTAAAIRHARELVADEARRWVIRRRGDELAPLIKALNARGDDVVRKELERWSGRLASLGPDEREAVESIARGVAAKLLHDPIVRLKERSEPGSDRAHARVLAELLGIDLDARPGNPR